jgi:hypothetical protein
VLSETNDDIMNEEYLRQLYSYISEQDATYSQDVSFEDFAQKMGSSEYAGQIYDYLGTTDNTFQDDVSQQDFLSKVGIGSEKKNSDSSFVEDSLDSTSAESSVDSQSEESTSESTEKTETEAEIESRDGSSDAPERPEWVSDAFEWDSYREEWVLTDKYGTWTDFGPTGFQQYGTRGSAHTYFFSTGYKQSKHDPDYIKKQEDKDLLRSSYSSQALQVELSNLQNAEDFWVDRYFKFHSGEEGWDSDLPFASWSKMGDYSVNTDATVVPNGNMFLSSRALEYTHGHSSQAPPRYVYTANKKVERMLEVIQEANSKEEVIAFIRKMQSPQLNYAKNQLLPTRGNEEGMDDIESVSFQAGTVGDGMYSYNYYGGENWKKLLHSTEKKEIEGYSQYKADNDLINKETGEFNSDILGSAVLNLEVVDRYNRRIYEKEAETVNSIDDSVLGNVGVFGYDFATGVMDLTNSFQSLYDREGAAIDMYYNKFRDQASLYEGWDLTAEQIERGISGNIEDGEIGAATAMFFHQAAKTTPQLLAQAAIAYTTRGLGTSGMMWASSAFMGASTFGRTWAETYGRDMSDEQAFLMSLGDAAVEMFSERVFASDIKALAGTGTFSGMTRKQIKTTMFKKGLLSKEMRAFATDAGIKFIKQGGEEALEEIIATIGSGVVHSVVNNEKMPSVYELLDSAIVGFGMGAGSTSVKTAMQGRGLLTAGVSAMGFGGLRSDLIKIRSNKQKLADELRSTTDLRKREALETKLKTLSKLEMDMQSEMESIYDGYTDEDATATIQANQKLSENMRQLRTNKNLSKEERARMRQEAKEQYNTIKEIEAKYEPQIAEMKAQTQANSEFVGGMTTSIEVDENTELPDTPLMRGIKNVANVFRGEGKVFLHKNLDDAEAISGVDKQTLAGSNGFYMAEDGSIHIMANMAQNNTAFHEGFHKILRKVDPKYAKRFIDAAFNGMDAATRAKYVSIYRDAMKQGGEDLAVEETFAEMAADIAVGDISMEGAGASVVRAGMESLRKTVGSVLGISLKRNGTFAQFAQYVEFVAGDFQSGQMLTETMGRFGESKVKEGTFFQLREKNLQDDNSQGVVADAKSFKEAVKKAKKASIKVAKGQTFAGSFINENTEFTNLATVVENFEKENGRPPKILFWMGDQSARGTYTTLDGTEIQLEGGISFSQDPANTDKGVVWATNKNNNEVQGLVKDADIVAIVSGKPETGHRFYKGTSRVVYTELMEAFNRNKGKSIEFPARGKNKFNIDVPTEGFTDPLQAIKFFYNALAENGKKPAAIYKESKEDKEEGRGNFMEETAKHDTLDSYLEESKGDRMSGLDMFLTTSGEMKGFMQNLGMKSDFDYQNDMRDGYLVENEFTTGDIYAFYEFERDADGKVVTQDGNHSTYSTDIKGRALGIANRKDNIYQIADLSASTTTEVKLSGKQQLELLVEAGELTQAQVDEINAIEDEKKRNKAKGDIIRSVAGRLRGQGKAYLADRLTAKSGYVSAEKAGDKSLKRIVSDAGTSYDGKTLLESLIVGQTLEGRMNVLQEAATQLTEEGNAKVREFKKKEGNFEMLSLPVGMVLERAAEIEGVSFKDMQESVNPETKRKAGIFFQSSIITSIAQRILLGEKKADIIASLRAKGMSRADANLIYAKASQNARGVKQGWKEGTRERSAQLAAKRKAERKAESSKAKDLRKKLAAVLKTEKKVSRNIINEMIRIIKEAGVEIKPTQVAQLIRTAAKVAKMKGRNAVDPDIRYEVLNSVVDKVVKIVEKQMDAKGLNDYINQLKRVEKTQKDLRNRFKKLKPTSRSPLISYAEQILDITSINPALLSAESLQLLEDTIKDLNISTKSVSVRKGELSNPYVEIEGLGKVDMRRAKVYFNEIFERLKVEEVSLQEKQLVEKAADLAFENGTDWVTEYEGLMRQINEKELKGVQKKLNAIADEMGLDLNDINDFEAALELYAEAKEEQLNKNRQVIIDEAIIPTFLNFRRLYESNPNFAAIFGITEEMEDDVAASVVKSRMDALTPLELKRLEFAMYDFAVNGKALGINALAASAVAKNDGNKALKALGLQSRETAKKTPLHWVSSRFENTPTFMRRIFKSSEVRIAKFMEVSGFSSLRNEASLADKIAEDFNQDLIKLAKQFGQTSIASQVRMQIYSVLTQKPEGVNQTQYLAQVIANFELSLSNDPRWSSGGRLKGKGKNQRKEIRETLDSVFYTESGKKKNYNAIVKELESDKNMMKMIDQLRSRFKRQGKAVKRYAEEFLGMNFKEEENYLPIGFRAVGSTNDDITKIQDDMANIQSAFNSYNLSKANKQASSTYERNENAMGSKTRYIDMNFYSSLSRTYRQNEVKTRTAYSVAKVSAMTSESNEQFKKVVRDPQDRRDMRRKIVQFLTDDIAVARSTDQMLGTNLAKFANEMNNLTVLYYFGGVFNQILKQSSAIMNTLVEGGNPLHLLGYVMTATTGKYSEGQRTILAQADIGQRDYIKETVNATVEGNALAEKNSWKRMRRGFFDASTAALRNTDKVAATASWLMYYESYMRKENGFNGKVSDEVWAEWGANIDEGASAYASTMVAKDQNVSTKRDKSDFNRLNSSQAAAVIQMLVMPFANFLLNKKINLALDFRNLGKGETRANAAKSIGGTALEVAAFHAMSQFVIVPIINGIASSLLGGEGEEEDSWFDREFSLKMFLKGMATDMNPLVLPIGVMESMYTKMLNLVGYTAFSDGEHDFEDRDFWENYKAWERANGLPIFSNAGRGDSSWLTWLKSAGVYGDMISEYALSIKNLSTLSEDNPYYVTSFGTTKYLSTEDANKMMNLETAKLSLLTTGAFTGLFSKESIQVIKRRERQIGERGITNENEAIGRMIINEGEKGTKLLKETVEGMVGDNPTGIEGRVESIIGNRVIKSVEADKMPSNKYINTIRDINKMAADPRDAAVVAKKVMKSMTTEEAKAFEQDLMKYYVLKEGEGALVKMLLILNRD